MLSRVVNYRTQLRHLLSPALPALPSSVSSSKFRILQLLCLPLLRKLPGCVPPIPNSELFARHSSLITRHYTQVFVYLTLPHSFALFCTFLHSRKTQLFYFQMLPHSLPKNTGVGG